MFLMEKRDGKIKGRTVAGGNKQRDYISKENVSSPPVTTESVLFSCHIFLQLSVSGAGTLVVRNAMEVQVSGLARLVALGVFATILWNTVDLSFPNFAQPSSTLNRSSGAALVLVPADRGSTLSTTIVQS
jgi:hypothetical protein